MGAETSAKLHVKEEDGFKYTGELLHGKSHGHGHVIHQKRGLEYWGEWKQGKFDGKGTYHWEKGTYEGEFKDGVFHGKGKRFMFVQDEVCISEAMFKQGYRKGRGRDTCIKASKYDGFP